MIDCIIEPQTEINVYANVYTKQKEDDDMKKRKVLAVLLTLSMCFAMAGCKTDKTDAETAKPNEVADSESSEEEASAEQPVEDASNVKIGYICQSMTNQGWLIINDGAQTAAEELGVDFQFTATTQNDVGAWLNAFEDLQNMGCQAIVFGGADTTTIQAIEAAVEKGIVCVEADSPSGAQGTYRIGISNYDAAVQGATWLAEAIEKQGTVVVVNGTRTSTSGQERREGFINTMNELAPDVEIFEVDSEWVQEKALNGVEDALTALDNDVAAIYCAWDGGTVAVASVLEQRGLTGKVKLMGFDGAADALGLMKEGKVDADVGQPLFKMGYEGVATALKAVQGEELGEMDIKLQTVVITPDMVDSYIEEAGLSDYVK